MMDNQLVRQPKLARSRRWVEFVPLTVMSLLLALAFLDARPAAAAPLTSPPRVLILDETVVGGVTSQEALAAQLAIAGCAVDVVSAANWSAIPATGTGGPTGYGFDAYRAIIIGDPQCNTGTSGYLAALTALNATKATWSPIVTGNIIIEGVDNALHSYSQIGADKTLKRGIAFAVNDPARTGLYYAMSCYYDYTAPATSPTLVPHLTGFGTFMTRNYPGTCFNDAHQVATHPVFTATPALTDAELSNWGCSTHEGFDSWPPSFIVLAIALTNGTYTATDGSNGVPYILVRGEGVKVLSNITLDPPFATNPVGTTHTVCATISTNANPRVGVTVTFTVTAGPNVGTTGTAVTDTNGVACFTYTDSGGPGTDYIIASFNSFTTAGTVVKNTSATVTKTWVDSCASVGCESLDCVTNGVWSYRFCVTNLTKDLVQYVSLLDLPPGVTVTPALINLSTTLATGQGTNLGVTVSGPVGLTNLCFTLGVHTTNLVKCCGVLHCVELPECCTRILTNTMTFVSSSGGTSTFNYQLTFQNLSAGPVKYVFFVPDQPCVTFVPSIINVTLPVYGGPSEVLPGQTRTLNLQVQVAAPCPGPLTYLLATHNSNLVQCCSSRLRLPLKGAVKLTSPPDGSSVLTGAAVVLEASVSPGITASSVEFFKDSTLLGSVAKAPYSLTVSNLTEGSYIFTAVALFDTGELESSEPVHLTVLSPHAHTPVPLSASVSGRTVNISLAPEPGAYWRIEYTDAAVVGPWTALKTVTSDGGTITVTDTVTNTHRFYRAVLVE
jgi:hypothetical protein